MKKKIEDLLTFFSKIDFGEVNLSKGEREFLVELNNELVMLCRSLPKSTQLDALQFLLGHLRTHFADGPNFFGYFYAPAWSIVYWLLQSGPNDREMKQKDIRNAKTAHSMAMFLHALDDHLNDNELPVTHLTLLLRSQSWMIMNNAMSNLADGVLGGKEIVRGFTDDYYSSIRNSKEIESLNCYCELFRKQMATWMIIPVLITKKMTTNEEFSSAIQAAYGSFGIGWRLLDDIKDIETDMMKGVHSSIYVCLSKDIKRWWDRDAREKTDRGGGYRRDILDYVLGNTVIETIKERICSELQFAASIADDHNMTGLADEFRCLLRPLTSWQDAL